MVRVRWYHGKRYPPTCCPSVHATQPNLRLLSCRLWDSEHVIVIVHAQPAISLSLPGPQTCPTPLVCGVDTKSYKPRPFLLHSTNSRYTYDLRPSPYYSSSRNKLRCVPYRRLYMGWDVHRTKITSTGGEQLDRRRSPRLLSTEQESAIKQNTT